MLSPWQATLNEHILLIGVSEQGPGPLRNDPSFDLAVTLGFIGMCPQVIPDHDVMIPDVATI